MGATKFGQAFASIPPERWLSRGASGAAQTAGGEAAFGEYIRRRREQAGLPTPPGVANIAPPPPRF